MPYFINVGPTVLTVTKGNGSPALNLVEEHELFFDGAALSTEFLGPADAEPAVLTQQLHDLAEVLAAHTLLAGRATLLFRQQRREVRAQLLAELLLLGRFPQIHRCFSYGIHGWQLLVWTLTRCPGGRCECLVEREAET
ncbi:hypothetical protein GCM10020255_108290 [Rhodococcus baikonurensis]